jgi:hypothetical protein
MELFEFIASFRFQHLQLQQRHHTEIHAHTANFLDLPRQNSIMLSGSISWLIHACPAYVYLNPTRHPPNDALHYPAGLRQRQQGPAFETHWFYRQ